MMTNDKLMAAFKMFDKDDSGTISPEEIKVVLCAGGQVEEAVINDIIKSVDENGDGEIQFEEFVKMMQSITQC